MLFRISNAINAFTALILTSWVITTCCQGTSASASTSGVFVDPSRAIVIQGPIRGNNLEVVNAALYKMGSSSVAPIDIVIDSPGGSVVPGFLFVNTMESVKAKGVTLRCYVHSVAASMAFQILTHCDERYALSRSFLLWHRVRTYGNDTPITAPLASSMSMSLQSIDDVIISELLETVGRSMMKTDVLYHFEQESLHIAANLARLAPSFLTSLNNIPGLTEALEDKRLPRTVSDEEPLFGENYSSRFYPGELIYIWRHYDL